MTHDEMIAVLQAYKRREAIEFRLSDTEWFALNEPSFNFAKYEYRIKPREPREFWITPDGRAFADAKQATLHLSSLRGYSSDIIHVREVIK